MDFVCLKRPSQDQFHANLEYSIGKGSGGGAYSLLFCAWAAMNLSVLEYKEDGFSDQLKDAAYQTETREVKYGNIESFLSEDSYYPSVGNGHRYSAVHPFEAVQDTKNCILLEKSYATKNLGVSATINFEKAIDETGFTMFVINNGIVHGSKNGYICRDFVDGEESECGDEQVMSRYSTCITDPTTCKHQIRVGNNPCASVMTDSEGCEVLRKMRDDYNNANVGPGTIEMFIPEFIQNRVIGWDTEKFLTYNRTVYQQGLKPDPRNPSDGTRNTGLLPQCSGDTCKDGGYMGKRSGKMQKLRDQIFRAERNLEIAGKLCGW